MTKPENSEDVDGECTIHSHPVPPDELGRYSVERDPPSEQDIANYVHGQARDESVQHVEKSNKK